MIQIQPQEQFPVVYTISDPLDSNLYYVRAVLRNSVTGAIINVRGLPYVDLVQGTPVQRYGKNIQAPHDASGLGFYIDVTVNVYTDSGYTTLSERYYTQQERYLVQQRYNASTGFGGGMVTVNGANEDKFNYKKVAETVISMMKELPKDKIPKTDLSMVYDYLEDLKAIVSNIRIPQQEKPDFTRATQQIIAAITQKLDEFPIPEPDMTPVLQAIQTIPFSPGMTEPIAKLTDKVVGLESTLKEEISGKNTQQFADDIGRVIKKYAPEDGNPDRIKKLLKQ